MPHPAWQNIRADVPSKRNTGYRNDDVSSNADVHNETERRKVDAPQAVVQQIVASAGGGSAPAAKKPEETQAAPQGDHDDLHKYALYVIVAHDHNKSEGDHPVGAPGYAQAGKASNIADAYALAASIAAREGQRCALYIEGSGGPWKEQIAFTSKGVDVVGFGPYRPVVEARSFVAPDVNDLYVSNLHFRSVNDRESLLLPPAPFVYPTTPDTGLRFNACDFSGARMAFYAQRPFFAEHSKFWSWQEYDPAGVTTGREYAPLVCEMDEPQSYFTWLRHCRMEAYQSQAFGASGPEKGLARVPHGYAIRASARRNCLDNGPWMLQMYSSDGILRTAVNVNTGTGAIATGLILDHCHVDGSLLCEGWFVSHLHCTVRGGIPDVSDWVDRIHIGAPVPPFEAMVYAVLRGHDWLLSVEERQFAMVQFDDTPVPSGYIARSENDPLLVSKVSPGGTAVWYRTGAHLPFNPTIPDSAPGVAHIARGAGVDTFLTTRASTSAQNWTSGTLVSGDGPGINPMIVFHPFSV